MSATGGVGTIFGSFLGVIVICLMKVGLHVDWKLLTIIWKEYPLFPPSELPASSASSAFDSGVDEAPEGSVLALEPPHAANESTIAVLSKTAKTFFFIVYIPPLNNELLFI